MNIIPRIWCPCQISFYSFSSDTVTASCQPVHQKTQTNPLFLTCMFTTCCYFPFLHNVCRKKKRRDVSLWHCLRLRRRNKHDLLANGDTVYSKLWFTLFNRNKYFAAGFLYSQLLGPNSAPMLQLIVWTKHRDSLPGVAGTGSGNIRRNTELVENYRAPVILLWKMLTHRSEYFHGTTLVVRK